MNIVNSVAEALRTNLDAAISEVRTQIAGEMMEQPHCVTCENCGEDLLYDSTVDGDGDIAVCVMPCECLLNEYKAEEQNQ